MIHVHDYTFLDLPQSNWPIYLSYIQVTELAGYTSRVHEMFEVFDDVRKGKYQRNLVSKNDQKEGGKLTLEKLEGPMKAEGLFMIFDLTVQLF